MKNTPLSSIFFQKVTGSAKAPAAEDNAKSVKRADSETKKNAEVKT